MCGEKIEQKCGPLFEHPAGLRSTELVSISAVYSLGKTFVEGATFQLTRSDRGEQSKY